MNQFIEHMHGSLKIIIGIIFIMTTFSMVSHAQIVQTDYNYLYISGQVTNVTNGAPVPDRIVYIESDLFHNPNLTFFDTLTTDQNGFFYDTLKTTEEKGAFIFTTYDDDSTYKTPQFFKFYSDHCYLINNFKIIDTATNNDFQASFYTTKDPANPNKLFYQFFDDSYGQDIRTWDWDFGDGHKSEERNPKHLYDEPGVYNVSLAITDKTPNDDIYNYSKIIQQVQVEFFEYRYIGGHVFEEHFPIDLGIAYLYKYDSNDILFPYDTAMIDEYGYYLFFDLLPGKYVTKADIVPQSVYYDIYIPTYFGDVLTWKEASTIILQDTSPECDIRLINQKIISAGEGDILGTISYGGTNNPEANPPAEGIEILLFDNNEDCVTFLKSDEAGNFGFVELPYDTYTVYAEMPGMETYPATVTIDASNPSLDNLNLIINSNTITFSIGEFQSEFVEGVSNVYPNPVREKAFVEIEMLKPSSLELNIYNNTGQQVYQENINLNSGTHRIAIDVKSLPVGYYTFILTTQDNAHIVKKLIKVN